MAFGDGSDDGIPSLAAPIVVEVSAALVGTREQAKRVRRNAASEVLCAVIAE